jgi:hypothetical protein
MVLITIKMQSQDLNIHFRPLTPFIFIYNSKVAVRLFTAMQLKINNYHARK